LAENARLEFDARTSILAGRGLRLHITSRAGCAKPSINDQLKCAERFPLPATLLASILRSVTGFGFAIAAAPLLTLVLEPHDSVILASSVIASAAKQSICVSLARWIASSLRSSQQ